jgi:hypothetical protein
MIKPKKTVEATDGHRSEGVPTKTGVTQWVNDGFYKNLFLSVSICGFGFFHKIQLPDLG